MLNLTMMSSGEIFIKAIVLKAYKIYHLQNQRTEDWSRSFISRHGVI